MAVACKGKKRLEAHNLLLGKHMKKYPVQSPNKWLYVLPCKLHFSIVLPQTSHALIVSMVLPHSLKVIKPKGRLSLQLTRAVILLTDA